MAIENMTSNLRIVTHITPANMMLFGQQVAGKEGYEIVLMEKIGNGLQYNRTLYSGQTTSFSQGIFGKYEPIAVDMRRNHNLEISDKVLTSDHVTEIAYTVLVKFQVQDSYTVACELPDPVRDLYDRIRGILADHMQSTHFVNVNEASTKRVLRGIRTDDLGLIINDIGSVKLIFPERVTGDVIVQDEVNRLAGEIKIHESKRRLDILKKQTELALTQMGDVYDARKAQMQAQLKNLGQLNEEERQLVMSVVRATLEDQIKNGEIDTQDAMDMIAQATDTLRERHVDYSTHIVLGSVEPPAQIEDGNSDDYINFSEQVDPKKDI